MRRILTVFLVLVSCVSVFYARDAHGERKHVTEFFEEKGITKAYIPHVKNSTGDSNVKAEEIKKSIEEALIARRSHAFEIAASEASADIIVEVDVAEYFWTEKDPVEAIFPPAAAAIDGAIEENYARMTADIAVKDAAIGRKLWGDKIRSTLTDDAMAQKESYGLIAKELAKDFVARLCKKPRKK